MYLLSEFHQCLYDGVIRHYFIPTFNLLSVKLTPEAKTELLELFDIIIQSDLCVLQECKTLKKVWEKFELAEKYKNKVVETARKTNFLNSDSIIITFIAHLARDIKFAINCRESNPMTIIMNILNITQHEKWSLYRNFRPKVMSLDHVINEIVVLSWQNLFEVYCDNTNA